MTRLFFVDESRDRVHHFHVGLLAEGPAVAEAETELNEVVVRAYDNGVAAWDSELHAKDMWDQEKGWKKTATPEELGVVFEEALSIIPRFGIEVIVRGANLSRFGRRYDGDPYRWEFSNVLERLNERLSVLQDFGLVIADQQHQYRDLLQRDVAHGKAYATGGYRSQRLVRVLDTAHFVDSSLSRMVQLTDVAAFILRRRASFTAESNHRLEALMARLHGIVMSAVPNPQGQYYTVR